MFGFLKRFRKDKRAQKAAEIEARAKRFRNFPIRSAHPGVLTNSPMVEFHNNEIVPVMSAAITKDNDVVVAHSYEETYSGDGDTYERFSAYGGAFGGAGASSSYDSGSSGSSYDSGSSYSSSDSSSSSSDSGSW